MPKRGRGRGRGRGAGGSPRFKSSRSAKYSPYDPGQVGDRVGTGHRGKRKGDDDEKDSDYKESSDESWEENQPDNHAATLPAPLPPPPQQPMPPTTETNFPSHTTMAPVPALSIPRLTPMVHIASDFTTYLL